MEQNDKKLRENNNNNNTNNNPMSHSLFLSENGCLLNKQPYSTGLKDHGFSFEAPAQTPPAPTPPPPPPSSKTYLYDFQNLGNQLPVHGSSSNQLFGVQTGSNFDPFDFYPYGSSANIDFYDYESKPFASDNSINGGHAQVMESFHGGLCAGGGAGGYFGGLSLQRNPSSLLGITNHHVPFMSQLQDMKPMDLLVPDDVSSASTADQAYLKKVAVNKNRPPVLAAARKPLKGGRRKNNVVKGQWTIDEDRLLIQLVDQFGIRKWSHIAQMLPGRIGKQCRERWHNHLRPDIKKDTWTEEEDKVLIQAHAEIGNKWAEIAKRLPGRTENSIKNHWNATKRRQYSKRKCRSKYPRGTLLQEYIKSLNLDSSSRRQQGKTSATVPLAAGGSVNANNVMKAPPTTTQPQPPPEALDFGQDDCLVPNYNFDEVPDFDFDEKIFKDGCTIDSLLDEIPCDDPLVDDDDMDVPGEDDATPLMDYEVKKEIDLVEMISQSKNPRP